MNIMKRILVLGVGFYCIANGVQLSARGSSSGALGLAGGYILGQATSRPRERVEVVHTRSAPIESYSSNDYETRRVTDSLRRELEEVVHQSNLQFSRMEDRFRSMERKLDELVREKKDMTVK